MPPVRPWFAGRRWRGAPHDVRLALPVGLVLALTGPTLGCGSAGSGASLADARPSAIVWEEISPPISFEPSLFNNGNFGAQTIVAAPSDPSIVYLGTCNQGIWRTVDSGDSWTKVNTGPNGEILDTGRNWTLAVDPTDAETVYTVSGYGRDEQGIWKSTDGGVSWEQILPQSVRQQASADIYSLAIDPTDASHILAGSHSGWAGGMVSGVLETRDGGLTWTLHQPQPSWGTGHYVFFLDSDTWLVTTQYDGFWRTENAGASWEQVTKTNMVHGGNQLYRTDDGTIYSGGLATMLRSEDEGRTWSEVGPRTAEGYYVVIGDGEFLYAQHAFTGFNTVEDDPPYVVSPEDDGTKWTPLNDDQVFANGPMSMTFDPESRILYSSNWNAGVWRLQL